MATIEQSIDVDVSGSTAYDQWTQFEEFPQFMEGVEEIRQLDDTHLHWVAEIGGAQPRVRCRDHRAAARRARRLAQHRRQGERRRGDVPPARRRQDAGHGPDGLRARGPGREGRRRARRRRPPGEGRPASGSRSSSRRAARRPAAGAARWSARTRRRPAQPRGKKKAPRSRGLLRSARFRQSLDRRSVRLCSRTSTGDRRRRSPSRRCTSIARSPTPTWKPCLRTSLPTTPASRATAFIRLLRPRLNRRAVYLRPFINFEPSATPPASPAAAAVPTSAGPFAFPTAEPTELAPKLTPDPTELTPDSIDLPTDPTESPTDCTTPLEDFLLRLRADVLRVVGFERDRDVDAFEPPDVERLAVERFAVERARVVDGLPFERLRVVDALPFDDRLRVALGARPFELPVDFVRVEVVPLRADDLRFCAVLVAAIPTFLSSSLHPALGSTCVPVNSAFIREGGYLRGWRKRLKKLTTRRSYSAGALDAASASTAGSPRASSAARPRSSVRGQLLAALAALGVDEEARARRDPRDQVVEVRRRRAGSANTASRRSLPPRHGEPPDHFRRHSLLHVLAHGARARALRDDGLPARPSRRPPASIISPPTESPMPPMRPGSTSGRRAGSRSPRGCPSPVPADAFGSPSLSPSPRRSNSSTP